MMNCKFCGFELKENETTCPFCNSKTDDSFRQIYEDKEEVIKNTVLKETYVKNDLNKEVKNSIRNSLGYLNIGTNWTTHIIYACGAYALMYLLTYLSIFIIANFIDVANITEEQNLLYSCIAQIIGELSVVGLTVFALRKSLKKFFSEFKDINTYKWFGIGFAMLYGLTYIYSLLLMLLNLTPDTGSNQAGIEQMLVTTPIIGILFVVIGAPLFEECIFRLGLFRAFTFKNKKTEIIGLIVTTIAFAMIHMVATFEEMAFNPSEALSILANDMLSLPSYLIGAFSLTFAYYKSKNLSSTILIHMCWNLMSTIMVLIAI